MAQCVSRKGDRILPRLLLVIAMIGIWAQPSSAQDATAGRSMTIIVGTAPGGSYDLYARVASRHFGKYLPGNPSVVVQYMPGANSRAMARHLYAIAPKDGTVLGMPLNTMPLSQMLEPNTTDFNAAEFNWIGAIASPANVLITWHTSGVRSIEEAREKVVTIGATAVGTSQDIYPALANNLVGTKFRIIMGYRASTEINVAMERGEVQGRGANAYQAYRFQNPEWIRDKKINVIFQMGEGRDPQLSNVPTLMEYAKSERDREIIGIMATTESIGRPFAAPPGVPEPRVSSLRKGLAELVKDAAFLADNEKAQLEVSPIAGDVLQKKVRDLIATPRDIVDGYRAAAKVN
jgi:tripartite-type tricarboxylate transporter receptor subunit TctC